MRIGLIAHGALPIPPVDWGAVEGTLWHRQQHLERLGHSVDIANTSAIHDIIYYANSLSYDFVHCHNEAFVLPCLAHLRQPFAITSHFGGFHQFDPDASDRHLGFQYVFRDTLQAPAHIVLSEGIRDLYLRKGYRGFLRVLRNGVELDAFRVAPHGNGRAVCLGRICPRKRQVWLAQAVANRVPLDLVGPQSGDEDIAGLETATTRYLGVWQRAAVYERLTDYSCLVLLSESEAAPKVVLEALAAGVSLVISDACSANLTNESFITILRSDDGPDVVAEAIQTAIERNVWQRDAIRDYVAERFDYAVVVPEYVHIIEDCRDYFNSVSRNDMG